jgi:hypothetical protein
VPDSFYVEVAVARSFFTFFSSVFQELPQYSAVFVVLILTGAEVSNTETKRNKKEMGFRQDCM